MRLLALTPVLCLALALALAARPAAAATVQVTLEVPQGKAKSVRLRKLPRGALLGIAISASGRIGVALVYAKHLIEKKPRALFRAVLERRVSFKVAIPESGDYYLVLDNRRGTAPVSVVSTIQAVRGGKRPSAPDRDGKFEQTHAAGAARSRSRPVRRQSRRPKSNSANPGTTFLTSPSESKGESLMVHPPVSAACQSMRSARRSRSQRESSSPWRT
jgi:hypothetical protein